MNGRSKAARVFVVLGSVVLLVSAAFHCFAGYKQGFPALTASNLNPDLQVAFRVIFLSVAWHWLVITIIALVTAFTQTRLRKVLVLICGLAVLLEAAVGATAMGLFIGNEMIGAAGLLIVCGGLLFDQSGVQA